MTNNANNMHLHNTRNGSNTDVGNASDVDLTMSKPTSTFVEVKDFKKRLAELEKKLGKCDSGSSATVAEQ